MTTEKWGITDILNYILDTFILPNRFPTRTTKKESQKESDLLKEKYNKQIRRIIVNTLTKDTDYEVKELKPKKGGKPRIEYIMTKEKAKEFVNTNPQIRKYFLREMYSDTDKLDHYFITLYSEIQNKDLEVKMYDENEYEYEEYYKEASLFLLTANFEHPLELLCQIFKINKEKFLKDFKDYSEQRDLGLLNPQIIMLDYFLKHPSIFYPLDDKEES